MSAIMLLQGHERRWIEENLEANDIPFVVIGGVAVKFYCPERERHDVDLFVGADPDQIERMVMAIPGLAREDGAKDRLLNPKIGHAEVLGEGLRIDVLSFATELDIAEALRTATPHEEKSVGLPILGLDLLIRHKEAVSQSLDGEAKDRLDIELLRHSTKRGDTR